MAATDSPSIRALAVSALFLVLLLFNLCLPHPQGPADNGDFPRNFSDFSDGPRGYAYFPAPIDPTYGERFFRHYHRFWRIGDPPPGHAQRSSSRLLFLPGRFLSRVTGSDFDLAANAAFLVLLLAAAAWATLRKLRGPAFIALAVLLLAMTDAGISAYSNSFYQEAGAFFFGVLFLCAVFLAWRRPEPAELAAALSTGFLLATVKRAYAPSVFLVLAAIVFAALLRLPRERARTLRMAIVAGFLIAGLPAASRLLRVEQYGRYNSFNVVFDALLPEIDPAERPGFLREVGLSPELAALSGRSAFEIGVPLESHPAYPQLGPRVHARALTTFASRHPAAFLRLLRRGVAEAGLYELPDLGYRARSFSAERQGPGGVRLWSGLRANVLGGPAAYVAGGALCLLLLLLPRGADPGGWREFFRVACAAFLLASLVQVAVAVLGDGPVERAKHLYFANLLFDLHFLLGLCGLGTAVAVRIGSDQPERGPSASRSAAADPSASASATRG